MLKSFIGPFVATFFISMFVLIMQFLWRMIDEIVGKGLEFTVIAELLNLCGRPLGTHGIAVGSIAFIDHDLRKFGEKIMS